MKLTAAALLLVSAISYAQQQAPPPLAQRIDVTLVNVDVTVLDRRGNPVTDLTKDDFELREDGVVRAITNFSAFSGKQSRPAQPETPFLSDSELRRSVAVLVDTRTFEDTPRRARAVDALAKLLDESPDDSTWSIIILRNGLRSLQTLLPMTSDRTLIKAALEAVRKGVSLPSSAAVALKQLRPAGTDVVNCPGGCASSIVRAGIDAAQEMESNVSFYSAVVQVARGIAWLPGKKAILIVSSAVPGYLSAAAGANAAQHAQLHERMVEEANAAGANIYVIDPLGISANVDIGHGDYFGKDANLPGGDVQRSTAAAEWLALQTGGLYLPSNDMRQSLEKFEEATKNYYQLAFHAAEADDKYHRLTVSVKRPGRFTITHRNGYQRLSREETFVRTMSTPVGIAAQNATLPVTLTLGDPQPDGEGKWKLPFRASIAVKSLQSLSSRRRAHVYVSAFDRDGRLVQFVHLVETISAAAGDETIVISRTIALPAGEHRLFVAIRDELTDEIGIATQRVSL